MMTRYGLALMICGVVAAGRLVRGANGFCGEIGHMVVDPSGPRCPCGGHGIRIENHKALVNAAKVYARVSPGFIRTASLKELWDVVLAAIEKGALDK